MLGKQFSEISATAVILTMMMFVLVSVTSKEVLAQNIEVSRTDTRLGNPKEVIEVTPKAGQVLKQTIETPQNYAVSVINYNITAADVDLVAFDFEGNEVGRETVTVAASENSKINLRKIFANLSLRNISTVEVQSFVKTVDYDANSYGYTYANASQLPVAFFSQRDSRWSGNKMGTCTGTYSTIGTVGCLISSISMAGANIVNNFNPASLNSYLSTRNIYGNPIGYSGGCNVIHSVAENIDGSGGLRYFGNGTVSSASNLKSLIDSGKFPVSSSTRFSSGHWVVIIGYKNSGTNLADFYYLDPWDTSATFHYIGVTDNFVSVSSATRIYN